MIGELLRLDEVVHAELRRVDAQIMRHDVGQALDHVDGFGHAEGAAVGDASRRLVGIDGIDVDVGGFHIVRAGADAVQPCRELGGVGRRIGAAVIRQRIDAQPGDLAVCVGRHLRRHVIIAGERVRLAGFRCDLRST